ncbi:uncharacterized protein LOC119793293 [Cyprinodon tularosa]|uniref:uncharacterized protein LOC119793293 n=1 Tax=Cyprinodon tularosa TaxID=77115 RepID=UPI0018E23E96|nr:uncharacterized protein LOC119793293 [Cyprinodon tularosa]
MMSRRAQQRLKDQNHFRTNAFIIIDSMLEWCTQTGRTDLLDEILHGILFLGKINKPPFSPEEIFLDLLSHLAAEYPRPFDHYMTHLPRRSPFSCVLDMVVHLTQPQNEMEIRRILKDLVDNLERGFLVSTAICVSQYKNSVKYGVSMSTTGSIARKIVTAASCLSSYWDEYVADAVMTFNLSDQTRRTDFDGTFVLPRSVTCRAYYVNINRILPPCGSCGELFGLHTRSGNGFPYGNCAEAESLSNLFTSHQEMRKRFRPTSEFYTEQGREAARADTLRVLLKMLQRVRFNTERIEYYTP